MAIREEVSPEFQELYEIVDKKVSFLASAMLEQISKNDLRILKKLNLRLDKFTTEIKEIQ